MLLSNLLVVSMFLAQGAELRFREGSLRGYPIVHDVTGAVIGHGTLVQRAQGERLTVVVRIDFLDGRRTVERAVMKQGAELAQLEWSFEESDGDVVLRRFAVDMETGSATAQRLRSDGKVWARKKQLRDVDGSFAGIGLVFLLKNTRERLDAGELVETRAVVFTPTPRSVTVSLAKTDVEELATAGRRVASVRYTIRPEVPRIAKLFVDAPDQHIWLSRASPPAFLQAEVTLAEPSDPIVHIDAQK